MEAAILEAESELERLQAEAADPSLATAHVRAAKAYEALAAAQAAVERLYARWAERESIQRGEVGRAVRLDRCPRVAGRSAASSPARRPHQSVVA